MDIILKEFYQKELKSSFPVLQLNSKCINILVDRKIYIPVSGKRTFDVRKLELL